MNWEETLLNKKSRLYIAVLSFALLIAGFVLDIRTSQVVVVAIIYNIPIALSSLALSRRLTLSLVGFALLGNIVAGYVNASPSGTIEAVAIANRSFAAVSFLLVGLLTLMLRNASSRVTALKLGEARAKRERDLRRLMTELSGPLRPQAFMVRSCGLLRELLEAEAVIITGLSHNRFVGPRYCSPPESSLGQEGAEAPWIVAATPTEEPPVLSSRTDTTVLTVGRWRRHHKPDLVVMVKQPTAADVDALLGEALQGLEPLLERAVLLEDLDHQHVELSRRNTIIRDLVYAFSHDLRTPIMANAMNMQLALDGAFGTLDAEFRHMLENGLSANQDLLELADSLLLVARYESGETPRKPEAVNLVALLQQTLARLEPVLEARALHIEVKAPEKLLVLGRPAELRRVFQNLLDNAVKFSGQGSTVEVKLHFDDQSTSAQGASLQVLDRGPGIVAQQRTRLFQRFSSGKAGGGTGLGLYLANQIVTEHGGTIRYEAREGGGSCFNVWLPVAKEAVTA